MHLEIKKSGKDTVVTGDSDAFRWLTTAANNAANGLEGNWAETTNGPEGRLVLQPLQPERDQLPKSRTAHAQARR